MIIRKLKWGFFAIIDEDGKEIAVAGSFSEAYKILKKIKKELSRTR